MTLHDTHTKKAAGRPPSLTKIEEQRYVTLRNWNFSQREAGALARNLPRGRNGARPPLGASTCQRLDKLHGPFAETLKCPPDLRADSLCKLSDRALVALADARGDVNNQKYREAAGLCIVVKRAKPAKRTKELLPIADVQPAQVRAQIELPEESITYKAWCRASSVLMAFRVAPTDTAKKRLAYVRNWCVEWSFPIQLDADARLHLTLWEQIAATWDGEFIADAARETLLMPFRDPTHTKITPANRDAILLARSALQSERPKATRMFKLPPVIPEEWAEVELDPEEWLDDEDGNLDYD